MVLQSDTVKQKKKITSVDKKNNRYHGEVGVTNFHWIDVLQNYSAYYIGIAIGYSEAEEESTRRKILNLL